MSNMKCPFCGQKMLRRNSPPSKVGVWQCQNYNDPDNVCIASGYLFNDDVLNYINRTRKALDVAVDGLKIFARIPQPIAEVAKIKLDAIKELEQKD